MVVMAAAALFLLKLKAKDCLSPPCLHSLTTTLLLQRLNHTLIANADDARFCPERVSNFLAHESRVVDMSKWKKLNASRFGITRSMIPSPALTVLKILRKEGFEAYLVGGCVRDLILKRVPKDYDVITTAGLDQIKKQFFRSIIVGRRFPICRVYIRGSVVEVSSFHTRTHAGGKENQCLSQMPFGCKEKDFILWRDSMRRDFTVNSLYYDPFSGRIYDYANGMSDLRSLKLQTVIPAKLSFQEDCARILRGIRIAGRLGLTIPKDTSVAIYKLSSAIGELDKSRIMMELNYMLSYGAAESTICLLQRYQLLEVFLPFHAAYLQAGKRSAWSSMMLMKLLFSLDKLVGCDRPCNCALWVGLLAFHQALVIKPQDALVIWAFASVLYHGKWQEGIRFARESAKIQVNCLPEISGSSEFKSDEELAEEVAQFASLVQDSAGAFIDSDSPFKPTSNNPASTCSRLVFVPKKTAQTVTELFNMLVIDIEPHEYGRKNFMIDYALLGLGHLHETRFVLGKVILDTLGMGTVEGGMEVSQGEQEFIDEKCSKPLSSLVNDMVAQKNIEHVMLSFDCGSVQEMDKKQKFLNEDMLPQDEIQEIAEKQQKQVEIVQLPEKEVNATHGSKLDENKSCQPQQLMSDNRNVDIRDGTYQDSAMQHKNTVEKCGQQILQDKKIKHQLSIIDSGKDGEMKRKERKDCHLSLREVVKEKTENYKQILVEERSGWPSLSALFRR